MSVLQKLRKSQRAKVGRKLMARPVESCLETISGVSSTQEVGATENVRGRGAESACQKQLLFSLHNQVDLRNSQKLFLKYRIGILNTIS